VATAGIGTRSVPFEIGFDAPVSVRDGLAALGRTEDVRLAPSGRRLAIACYANRSIAVADIELGGSSSGPPEISVTSLDHLASPALHEPHGLDFVDDETLVVADRTSGIAAFRLPSAGGGRELIPLGPTDRETPRLLDSPGSVAVRTLDSGGHEVLVCNNEAHTVTRHRLDAGGAVGAGEVALHKWLELPDGLSVSRDGRWLAVSNHDSYTVMVFELSTLNEHADPVAVLRGAHYPHGVRFASGDRHIVLADAGAPHVHVFASSHGGWRGVGYPTLTLRVMDDETFARGRHNPQEGGPKGIEVDPRTNVLVMTSECTPLSFFDLEGALERDAHDGADDALVRYELHVLADRDRIKAETDEAIANLHELQQTKAWRLTAPMRRAHEAAAHLKRRFRR
jgi:hypothetical protein